MKYVVYIRCSTRKQDYGMEAQLKDVQRFVSTNDEVIGIFKEQESGRSAARPELLKALNMCREMNSSLLIARLDRLSRSAYFTFQLLESKVDFVCIDMPSANKLTIGLMAVIAEAEADRISHNTKKGLAIAKASGKELGTPKNLTHEAKVKGARANQTRAQIANKKASKIIIRLRNEGYTYEAIATELNQDGYHTSTGGQFSKMTVRRLYYRGSDDSLRKAS